MKGLDSLAIELRIYREQSRPQVVVIRYVIDDQYRVEQEYRLQSTSGTIEWVLIVEACKKIISRIVEGSVFNDASPPRTAAAVQSETSPPTETS